MRASEFLKLAESDPDAAKKHILDLLNYDVTRQTVWEPLGDHGHFFFEMWDALPREGGQWHYALIELVPSAPPTATEKFEQAHRYTMNGWCHAAGINFDVRGRPHGPTRNLAVAAALSEARHEENDDG